MVTVIYVPEPTNKFDPKAVSAYITHDGGAWQLAGYVSKKYATPFFSVLAELAIATGQYLAMNGWVQGSAPNYEVHVERFDLHGLMNFIERLKESK